MSLFYCFSEKPLLIKVKARYKWGRGCSAGIGSPPSWRHASLSRASAPVPLHRPPCVLRIHQAPDPHSKNWGRLPARVGLEGGQAYPVAPSAVACAPCSKGRGVVTVGADRVPSNFRFWGVSSALCLGAHGIVKGSPSSQGTELSTEETGHVSGSSKPQSKLEGIQPP